ncbi:hypothetical protein BDN72DRAFT_965779 [Pluteus cervinus]|uniref:Uncharacterized protein n=1 Tax=Pluteus cervinus TaxID=181527 RepID=A0ACD3A319_9AGAR|nr:hypothetical protein BDN72DRAFT_965779 [Pluteus cervinus]
MTSPTAALRAQLGLGSKSKDKAWKVLRTYMISVIKAHMDLLPGSKVPSEQKKNFETVVNTIEQAKAQYFSTEDDVKALRRYLVKQINNIRFVKRQSVPGAGSSRSHSLRTVGDSTRSRTTPNSTPSTPYSFTTRPQKQRGRRRGISPLDEDDPVQSASSRAASSIGSRKTLRGRDALELIENENFRDGVASGHSSADELTLRPTRRSNPQNMPSPSTSSTLRLPLRDLDPRLPMANATYTRTIHRPQATVMKALEPSEDNLSVIQPQRDPELVDFLENYCRYPLPHLYTTLRAYGCRDMDDLRFMSEFPLPMIMEIGKRLRTHHQRDRECQEALRSLDWDTLVYGIWSLGGKRRS